MKKLLPIFIALLCFVFAYRFYQQSQSPRDIAALNNAESEELPNIQEVPYFQFEGINGEVLSRKSLEGKVWVIDFMFTACPGQCSKMSRNMAKLQKNFLGNQQVQFVSVTVDPKTDSREVLGSYAKAYGADTTQWHFLRGNIDSVKALAVDGLHLQGDPTITTHSPYFVLVDEKSQVRGYYQTLIEEENQLDKLKNDINKLLKAKG